MRLRIAIAVLLALGGVASCAEEPPRNMNEEARDRISAAGVDPSGELLYEHFLYFEAEADARAAAAEMPAGFDVEVVAPDQMVAEWLVLATQRAALTSGELDAVVVMLEDLATRFGGMYDGWGASLNPDV